MTKFNVKKFTKTHQGGKSIAIPNKNELVKLCLTSFLEKTYYESAEDVIQRIVDYSKTINQTFLLKLAIFSRNYGLKSINHLLAALFVINNSWIVWTRKMFTSFLKKMVKRPDELWEILWAFNSLIDEEKLVVPNMMKVAFKEVLENNFSKYQLQKYKNKGNFKLHDIVNLVHAKGEFIDLLMKWEIGSADTRETKLSAGESKQEAFEDLIDKNKLWTKALLMNMKNIIEAWINQDKVAEYINKASLMGIFPFDVMKALHYLWETNQTKRVKASVVLALENMAIKSFGNLPLDWKVAVICDTSGSMSSATMSNKSEFRAVEVAAFYTALAYVRGDDTWAFCFDTQARAIKALPWDGLARVYSEIVRNANGGWTYVQSAIDLVKSKYDTAIIFTDSQFADDIRNTGNLKQVIVANLCWYKWSIAIKWNIIEISWYNDTMLKLASDIRNIDNLVKQIEAIEL